MAKKWTKTSGVLWASSPSSPSSWPPHPPPPPCTHHGGLPPRRPVRRLGRRLPAFSGAGLIGIRRTVKNQRKALILLAMSGAFIFVISSLKIPSVTGSCAT